MYNDAQPDTFPFISVTANSLIECTISLFARGRFSPTVAQCCISVAIASTSSKFAVTEINGKVSGCASLYIYNTGLAEIRSLGIDPKSKVTGQGRQLVEHLLAKAKKLALNRVIVLTRVPDFFEQQRFTFCSKDSLPEKVMKDCELCLRKENCDEVAMEYILKLSTRAEIPCKYVA